MSWVKFEGAAPMWGMGAIAGQIGRTGEERDSITERRGVRKRHRKMKDIMRRKGEERTMVDGEKAIHIAEKEWGGKEKNIAGKEWGGKGKNIAGNEWGVKGKNIAGKEWGEKRKNIEEEKVEKDMIDTARRGEEATITEKQREEGKVIDLEI